MTTGVHTRQELRAAGVSDAKLSRLLRRGQLVRVGYAQYTRPGEVLPVERLLARAGRGVMLSHASAARARGLPTDDGRCHVTVPNGSRCRWAPPGVVVHQTRRFDGEIVDGVAMTTLARTLADIAVTAELDASVPVLDSGLRAGVGLGAVAAELLGTRHGQARALRALFLADARSESPLESKLRLLLTLAGLRPDGLQHAFLDDDGRVLARCDLWYDGVVVEADGFEFHSEREAYRRDRRRMQLFASRGLLYLPFSWEDVVGRPRQTVATVRTTLAARDAQVSAAA